MKRIIWNLRGFSLIILIYILAQGFLYSFTSKIPVTINNKSYIIKSSSSIGEALRRQGYNLNQGNLLNLKGETVLKKGGRRPLIYLNDKPVNETVIPKRDDRIHFIPGKDIKENIKIRRVAIPFRTKIIGSGNFIGLRSSGVKGEKEETFGSKSGKIVSSKIIRYPEEAIIRRSRDPSAMKVALTFDDGPDPTYTRQIISILKERKVPATFFVIGLRLQKYPEIAAEVAANGFAIGSHSFSHARLDRMPVSNVGNELDSSKELIAQVTKVEPKWLRPPFGKVNSIVTDEAAKRGYKIALWNVDSLDWRAPDPEFIWQQFVTQVKPGAVVLLHDGGGDRHNTVAVLPRIIKYLRDNGYELVKLEEIYGQ